MLGLLKPTDPTWVEAARADLPRLLVDHAHCELKAAQSALSLVGRNAGAHPELVEPLLALAKEETEHFHGVIAEAHARGVRVHPPEPDAYVAALMRAAKPDSSSPLLDRLIVAALIEARSCERFKLLAEGLDEPELAAFYRDLMASEARHHRLFVSLAEQIFGKEGTRARLETMAAREAEVVGELALGPTVHG